MRGVECIAEVVPVIIRNHLILGIDRILPNHTKFAAGGKVPDELQIDREGIEIDVVILIVIASVQSAVAVQGIVFKIFRHRPVMPRPQRHRGFGVENIGYR